ncbi:HD domain-containing protein [Paenibacillus filicis]|uniref:HD domain-containing protein n=1 Tax=Paenibacillus gyeongsangnamensis TaxID=3388067 RepID=A0ABT4QBH8_9BACL|nr:HD domain-containing phosphohydrolase [Paenibacillus filicis]MCZ8514131.1 HD domain-containing protein [Paenibacillus filicis]
MRLLPIPSVRPGMRLGKAIVSDEGKTLLGDGMELTQGLIHKLRQLGYHQLYVVDPRTEDIVTHEPLRDETLRFVRTNLIGLFQQLQRGGLATPADRKRFSATAERSIQLIMEDLNDRYSPDEDTVMLLHSNRRHFTMVEHFFHNALNVCVYAARIAMLEHYDEENTVAFSMGALLHDIGNTQISPALLQKASALSPLEYAEIQKHTEFGYRLLKDLPGVPPLSAFCALQHHEKIDGTGYPDALTGPDIHPFALWVGMLDAYDAMTNPRPYRPAISPDHALELLFTSAGTHYPKAQVEYFRNRVAIYPLGVSVRLSTGETGIVCKINLARHRPVVRVLTNPKGEDLCTPYEIDLSRHLHIMIHRVGEEALVHS